jgi:hypothetical protein
MFEALVRSIPRPAGTGKVSAGRTFVPRTPFGAAVSASLPSAADPDRTVVEPTGRERDAMGRAATILREVAAHDRGIDPVRAAIGSNLAALVEAVSRHLDQVPAEVSNCARSVAEAVDRATGNRP